MKLYIKNMVCNRCIIVVKQELEKLKLKPARRYLPMSTITIIEDALMIGMSGLMLLTML